MIPLPHIERLWSEPLPGSRWLIEGRSFEVLYVEGAQAPRRVVTRTPLGAGALRGVLTFSLWRWRFLWLFARRLR